MSTRDLIHKAIDICSDMAVTAHGSGERTSALQCMVAATAQLVELDATLRGEAAPIEGPIVLGEGSDGHLMGGYSWEIQFPDGRLGVLEEWEDGTLLASLHRVPEVQPDPEPDAAVETDAAAESGPGDDGDPF